MLRFFWRRRCAATLALFAVPCGVHARCGRPPEPPPRWRTFDFVARFDQRRVEAAESAFLPIRRFVSPLVPGQFETSRRPIFDYEPDGRDTGFRGNLDSFVASEAFPSHLDGAHVDVTRVTSEFGAADEALRAFLAEFEDDAVILGHGGLFERESRDSLAVRPRALETTPGYLSFSSDAWKLAEAPEEWFDAAEVFASAKRDDASPGRLVFDSDAMPPNAMASVLLNPAGASLASERAEMPWPERRVVATLTVSFVRSAGCRGFSNLDPVTLRFPLAVLSDDR